MTRRYRKEARPPPPHGPRSLYPSWAREQHAPQQDRAGHCFQLPDNLIFSRTRLATVRNPISRGRRPLCGVKARCLHRPHVTNSGAHHKQDEPVQGHEKEHLPGPQEQGNHVSVLIVILLFPSETTSPSLTAVDPTARPFRYVPFVESRSWTKIRPPSQKNSACRRETSRSSNLKSALLLRPTTTRPAENSFTRSPHSNTNT